MHNPELYGQPLCVCLHLDSDMSAAFLRFPRALCLRILAALDMTMVPSFSDAQMVPRLWFRIWSGVQKMHNTEFYGQPLWVFAFVF